MCVGTGTAVALALGGATAGAGIYAANKQAGAAHEATQAQTAGADKAATLQAQSAADALAYTKQQAEQARIDADTTQRANYGQWAARQGAINALGAQYGVGPRAIPAYQSTLAGAAAGPPAPGSAPAGTVTVAGPAALPPGGVSAANGPIAPQVAAYFAARGVTPNPTSVDYWAAKWNEFGAKDPEYFNRRLAVADEFGGAPSAPAPGTVAAAGLPRTAAAPGVTLPITPGVTVDPYQRRTVRDYFA